jgi:hypothetical protein
MHLKSKDSVGRFNKWKQSGVLALMVCSSFWALQPGLAQNSRQVLPGHVPAAAAHALPTGRLASSANLRLAIGLPLRNKEALTNLLQQLYDPASPSYRHWLTPEQFTESFGPTPGDYQALIDFAKANGLKVTATHPNRVVLDVVGAVADIEKVCHVTMRVYQHPKEARTFHAPDGEPSLDLTVPVLHISGLDDYSLPHPNFKAKSLDQTAGAKPNAGSGPSGTYRGGDFRAAYVPGTPLTGAGQTVGLVQFDGYYASDIAAYVTQAGLPGVPLTNVPIDGGVPTPGGNNAEVCLDIEMVISMAPGASRIYVYEAPNPSPWVDILGRMANDNLSKQLSCSWGGGPPDPTAEGIFQQMAAQGQSFFCASGDFDAFTTAIDFPDDSPHIMLVGGTTLTTSGPGGAYVSETVWNWGGGIGSAGGISTYYALPAFQQGISMVANHGSTSKRNIPDVALTADNIYVTFDKGSSGNFGGTSCAAPLWAGFVALVNQQVASGGGSSVGFINPAIYTISKGAGYASDFHDITTGDNTSPDSPANFFAVPGYDLCTGLGTPTGINLINALASPGGTPDGLLEVSITPFNGETLLAGSTQKITVQVTDVLSVTNAVVIATVNGTNLTFLNNGIAPDVGTNDSIYSANLSVPLATNDLTLSFRVTAPGKTNSTNVVTYSVVPVPVNDYFTNAIKAPPAGAAYLSNNKFGTKETGEPQHAGVATAAASLWWNWSPSSTTNVFIDTTGSAIDTVLAVYTGSTVSGLTQVVATNDVGLKQQAYLNFNATGGASYRIAVASASSNSLGSLRLLIAPGGQVDTNRPTVSVTSPLNGQWVSNFLVTVSGTANDPQPNASGLTRVFVGLNGQLPLTATGTANWSSTFGLSPGLNTIKVTAEDLAGNISLPVSLDVTFVVVNPVNDLFVNALPLSGNSGSVSATTTNATKQFGEPNHVGNAGGKSVWWSFTPSSDGVLALTTTNSTFDTLLALYTGTQVAELTTVASNDDAYVGASRGFSSLAQAVRSNQTYYVAVDGFDGAAGVVSLGYTFTSASVFSLTTSSAGGGQVTPGSSEVASNSTVILTATPDPFFEFANWTGSFLAAANPLSVVVNSNLDLTAHFRPISFSDDFETGNLLKLNWSSSGNVPWTVESSNVLSGSFSARSGVIGNSQTSSLMFTTNFGGGSASFYLKVSSELNWDFLGFYVDAVLQQQWSGEIGWTSFSFPLPAGTHTLEWRYTKDANVSVGLDAAFVDNVRLPFSVGIDASTPAHLQMLRQADGSLLLQVLGQTNQQYVIQGTANLAPPISWQNLSTNIATGGAIQYVDPGTGNNPLRFYRAIVPVP